MSDTTVTGTTEHLDPASLVIETNVRPSTPLTPAFVQSVRENGVLTPVLARRDSDGSIVVRAGQRRTLAAREAELSSIPVYIVDADDVATERIVQQLVENDQREALTDGDRATAFQQLVFEGLSVTAIARRTATKPREIKTALAVAENSSAATAIHEHALTLDQAAVLIEFEDNDDIKRDLIEVATHDPAQFTHAAQRARDEKVRLQIKSATEADLTGRGYTVLENDPGYYDTGYSCISDLLTAEGERVTVEHIENMEGRAARVRVYADGDAHITYFVSDPKAAGYHRYDAGGNTSGPMSDEQKAERRTLIANNKAWASAETVRREWVATLLSRKTLPKDVAVVIANGLTIHRQAVSAATRDGNPLAHVLLGIEQPGYAEPDKLAGSVEHTPAKAQQVSLAIVLGACESVTSKQSWRYPNRTDAAYLAQLAAWGYSLSEVEQIVTASQASAAQVDDSDDQPAAPVDDANE
ncbi:ParB/RepB/Spo0J family partition protein [Diaminobutyricibacter tongyongensis]|uniref:ParB/RepB/Spo0J family partition protein n=1 Tax=Leifsonia tongyongensis TaxID=1268043 RepID=A0A6L9Y1Y7_9MICO|nr:ParB/RepB/Spo0J family partition protein [Diaminobutyricibacter tongyongensis]NEN07702.1 ParB/RepB/Spo0J family partition protein [Diaminobutyricibacter tongyongensis]